jgi:membrane fusion protein, multidrug efflux system
MQSTSVAREPGAQRPHRIFTWAAHVGVWAIAILGVAVALFMLGQFIFYRFTRSMTNDAFVESHIVNLSAEVEGLVTRVHVEEHELVRAGQVLVELDHVPAGRELNLATAKRSVAETTLAFEQATLERLEQQFPRQVAVAEKDLAVAESELNQFSTQLRLTTDDVEKAIAEAAAAVASARAVLVKTTEDYDRYKKLFEQKSVPQRRFEDATRDFRTAQADLDAVQAKLGKAESDRMKIEIAQLVVTQKQRARERSEEQLRLAKLIELEIDEQRKQVAYRKAQVEQAQRDEDTVRTKLQYTRVVAPFDAVVVRRFRNPGDHAPVGSPILSVYDPELVYITAYLEEERLEGVSPGNPVRIWLDAISGSLNGRVVWIDRATGANFALVPRIVFTSMLLQPDCPDQEQRRPFDFPGFVLLLFWVACMMLALFRFQKWGWQTSSGFWLVSSLGLLALTAFFVRELTFPEPLLDLRLFAIPRFALCVSIKAIFDTNFLVIVPLLTIYLAVTRDYMRSTAGLVFLPAVVAMGTSLALGARYGHRGNRRIRLIFGLATMAAGSWLLSDLDLFTDKRWTAFAVAVLGFGAGMVASPAVCIPLEGLDQQQVASSASIKNLFRVGPSFVGSGLISILIERHTDARFDSMRQLVTPNRPPTVDVYRGLADYFTLHGYNPGDAAAAASREISQFLRDNATVYADQAAFQYLAILAALGAALACLLRQISPDAPGPKRG